MSRKLALDHELVHMVGVKVKLTADERPGLNEGDFSDLTAGFKRAVGTLQKNPTLSHLVPGIAMKHDDRHSATLQNVRRDVSG